jgi:hypothetical protein
VNVESDASPDLLEDIRVAAERTSPMFDNVRNGAAIDARIEKVG